MSGWAILKRCRIWCHPGPAPNHSTPRRRRPRMTDQKPSTSIPVGLCQCGCGQRTKVSDRTDVSLGYVVGTPRMYFRWHSRRPAVVSYRAIKTSHGYINLHRVRAEQALGKPLPKGAVVHHADGTKSERSVLVICESIAYHHLLHARMRVKAAGGNPNTDAICYRCHKIKPFDAFYRSASGQLYRRCRMCCYQMNSKRLIVR